MDSSFRHNSTQRPELKIIVKHSKQRWKGKDQKIKQNYKIAK